VWHVDVVAWMASGSGRLGFCLAFSFFIILFAGDDAVLGEYGGAPARRGGERVGGRRMMGPGATPSFVLAGQLLHEHGCTCTAHRTVFFLLAQSTSAG